MKKWLPLILTMVMAGWFLGQLRAPKEQGMRLAEFGRIPLLFNGRLQPMDSLARNSLLQIREKQTANLEPWKGWNKKPKIIPAIEWLATVEMNPTVADQWPVFRVDNPELTALLKLPEKDEAKQCDGKHYSWMQIQPSLDVMQEQTSRIRDRERAKKSDASQRTAFEKAVMKLQERLFLYMRLKNTLQPQNAVDWEAELAAYEQMIPAGVAAIRAKQGGAQYDQAVYDRFVTQLNRFDGMAQFEPPLVVPPPHSGDAHDWSRVGEALLDAPRDGAVSAAVRSYAAIGSAFRKNDAAEFNKQVAAYRVTLAGDFAAATKKAERETFFNRMQPFYNAMVIYILAGLLACASWFNLSEMLRRSAVWLIGLAFVIHTTGLIFRMALEGRPPVTNLYSSAIFIGWGAVVLGAILERFYKDGIGAVVASVVGFVTLIIAHHLALTGDTMEMMRAVLDTNFWLATHVVVVTLGYASTFVAGFLAIIYVVLGVFTPRLKQPMTTAGGPQEVGALGKIAIGTASVVALGAQKGTKVAEFVVEAAERPVTVEAAGKALSRMVYAIVCFATLFSFVGTVLGGIWADQSWGRFWGWDPKENGALIIVLWNAMVLHLRWGGIVRERGLICCAIVGNIVTSWSWFGVNMLGIGLHSYGFTDAAFLWLLIFVVSQLTLIALGSLPLKYWKSFSARGEAPA